MKLYARTKRKMEQLFELSLKKVTTQSNSFVTDQEEGIDAVAIVENNVITSVSENCPLK